MATPASVKNKIQRLVAAANAKTGKTDTTLTAAVNRLIDGHLVINGEVVQCKVQAGGSVTAGDFVNYSREWGSGQMGDYASASGYTSGGGLSAVALSDSKVLVAYVDSNDQNVRAVIVTVDGPEVLVGEPLVVSTTASGATGYVSAVGLSDSKVLVAYSDGTNNSYGTAAVLTVNGTTITKGTPCAFSNKRSAAKYSLVLLSANKALVAYQDKSIQEGAAAVLSVIGTTVTAGKSASFDSLVTDVKAATLTEGEVLVVYGKQDYYSSGSVSEGLKVVRLSVTGTTVTAGTSSVLQVMTPAQYLNVVALDARRALVMFRDVGQLIVKQLGFYDLSETYYDTFDLGNTGILTGSRDGGIVAINSRRVLQVGLYPVSSSGNLAAKASVLNADPEPTPANYSGIEEYTNAQFTTSSTVPTIGEPCLVLLSESSALLVSNLYTGSGYKLHYRHIAINDTTVTPAEISTPGGTIIKPATESRGNIGVAKTSGASGDTVGVYIAK